MCLRYRGVGGVWAWNDREEIDAMYAYTYMEVGVQSS